MSDADRMEWRKTGTLPEKAPALEAESPTATVVQDPPVSTETKIEPVSDAGEYKTKTAARISELLENQRRERERADRLERELNALRQPPPALTADSPTATADPKPDPSKYDDLTKYFDDVADWSARKALRQRDIEVSQRTQEQHAQANTERLRESWKSKWAAASEKHKDFAQVVGGQTEIPAGSLVDAWILEADEGAEVLYHLQKNPAELSRILALTSTPMKQAAALVKLGEQVTAVPSVKTITSAPDPAPTLGVRGADTLSDVGRAVKKRDVRAYREAQNALDIAAKGR